MKYTLLASLLLLTSSVFCQTNRVSATVSTDSILLGNYFILTISSEEDVDEVDLPNLEDFDIVSGPNISSSMQIINGDVTSKKSWSYHLQPKDYGSFYIEPIKVLGNSESYYTEPLEINVYPNPDNIIQNQSNDFNDLFQNFQFNFDFPEFPDLFEEFKINPEIEKDSIPKTKRKLKKI